jgi:hypothetical protein
MKKSRVAAGLLILCALMAACLAGCGAGAETLEEASRRMNTYVIEGVYRDEGHSLTASETLHFTNRTGAALDTLCFNLYPNAYREDAVYKAVAMSNRAKAYPYGASWGRVDINYARVGGANRDYRIEGGDRNILAVPLSAPLAAGGAVSVAIGFTVHLAHVYDRLGYNNQTVHLTNWYPVLCVYENGGFVTKNYCAYGDPFYSEAANYSVTLTYPSRYSAAHTGEATETRAAGGNTVLAMSARCVRDFAVALSAPKTAVDGAAGQTAVRYHYLTDTSAAENLLLAERAMETYAELFGPYPYSKIEIFETPFAHGGMEYPGLILVAAGLTPAERREVIVHELAHQWWYGLVGNNQHDAAWFDEGLSDFSTLLFFKKFVGYGVDKDKRVKQAGLNYGLFVDVLKAVGDGDDTTMTRSLLDYVSEREYVFMTYVKGLLLFDTLHKTLGEKTFLRCLQRLYADNLFGVVTDREIIAAFEKASRKKLGGFFRSWLDGKVVIARLAA